MNPSIQAAIETRSAANIVERFGDTLNTMTLVGGLIDSDRERMDQLVSLLYGEAIALHQSAEILLKQN